MEASISRIEGESEADRRYRAEDAFRSGTTDVAYAEIMRLDRRSTVVENDGSLSLHFGFGFFMGVVLGYIVIVWLADRSVSKGFKLGIASGMLIKMLYQMAQSPA